MNDLYDNYLKKGDLVKFKAMAITDYPWLKDQYAVVLKAGEYVVEVYLQKDQETAEFEWWHFDKVE